MRVAEALSEGEACLIGILLDQSGLELAEFSWYNPESADGCWRARPYQWKWWRDKSPLQIDQCVAAGQRVLTERGLVPIEEVVVGDQVRTHRGRWRSVLSVWDRGRCDVVRIQGDGVDLVLTARHEVWCLSEHRAKWLTPSQIADRHEARVRLTGRTWAEVDAVTPAGAAQVYDLEVEEDNSFVVEGVAVHNCARDVGKTTGIVARANAFPFCRPGGEMVITAPELVHLMQLTDAIERIFHNTRLCTEIMPRGRSKMIRRPFRMNFTTGAFITGRIPQVTGRGVKGLHAVSLEMDEAQDYPEQGWVELTATLRRGIKGAMWRAHGVTRGIRDKFFEFTQPSDKNPWKVHRIVAMHRDDWSDEERQTNIQLYGAREAPDYRRNILGLHGDPANALFVLSRLMRCVDSEEGSDYNREEYQRFAITAEQLEEMSGASAGDEMEEDWVARQVAAAIQLLDFSDLHSKYEVFWAGQDVGYTIDPSEILIAAEYEPPRTELAADRKLHRAVPEKGITRMRLVCRIQLKRVSNPVQVAIVNHVINHYKPRAYGLDKTGNGIGLFMDLQALDLSVASVVRGYNFSEKVIVGIDGTVEVTDHEDVLKEAALKSNVLEFSTDKLRELVDQNRWMMPFDRDMLREFQGQTWAYSKALNAMDSYGRPRRVFSQGNFHTLDAARMLAMAHAQAPIEDLVHALTHPNTEPVYDSFL